MSEHIEKRKKAFDWWKSVKERHVELTHKHFTGRSPNTLTGREIQQIWEKELDNQSKVEYTIH